MFEWDEEKHQRNTEKQNLDFLDAGLLFDRRPVITGTSDNVDETRFVTVGKIGPKFYSVIWTRRAMARRITTFKRALNVEERAYRQTHS
jgi:uncharacterized protein